MGRMGAIPPSTLPTIAFVVPSETSQEARDRLLNHNDMLTEENQKLQRQLWEQNAAHGRHAHNDILWAAPPFSDAEQNLAEAM